MLFAVICRDKPESLALRVKTRDAHVKYLKSTPVQLAGPFVEEKQMCGSLVVVEASNLAAAQAWARNDPYAQAGLFESVTVMEWTRVIG